MSTTTGGSGGKGDAVEVFQHDELPKLRDDWEDIPPEQCAIRHRVPSMYIPALDRDLVTCTDCSYVALAAPNHGARQELRVAQLLRAHELPGDSILRLKAVPGLRKEGTPWWTAFIDCAVEVSLSDDPKAVYTLSLWPAMPRNEALNMEAVRLCAEFLISARAQVRMGQR